jgi:hypothetical protein
MKTKLTLLALSFLTATTAFGSMTVDASKLRKNIAALRTEMKGECKTTSLLLEKAVEGLPKAEQEVCSKATKQFILQHCQTKLSFLSGLVRIANKPGQSSIAKNLGEAAPADAVAAVINWKVDREIKQLESDLNKVGERFFKNSVCQILGNLDGYQQAVQGIIGEVRDRLSQKAGVRTDVVVKQDTKQEAKAEQRVEEITEGRDEALELELHRAGVQ